MHASAIRLALLGAAAAALAGCATGEPTSVAWQRQSTFDQHRFMPSPMPNVGPPMVVVKTGPTGAAIAMQDAPREAMQAVAQGDSVRLVTQEEYARLRSSDPQVLGGAPAEPGSAPAAPATK